MNCFGGESNSPIPGAASAGSDSFGGTMELETLVPTRAFSLAESGRNSRSSRTMPPSPGEPAVGEGGKERVYSERFDPARRVQALSVGWRANRTTGVGASFVSRNASQPR